MKHRVALVGAGEMGAQHARIISTHERTLLTRVVDPRESSGKWLADRHGCEWHPAIGTLSDVDAVVLASPTGTHHNQAIDVLSSGKPLLVEKPLSNNFAACLEITEAARRHDVVLMCSLVERYNPAMLTARMIIEAPVHVLARRHGPYAPHIRTGVGWDLLVHDADLAIQLFNWQTPEKATASSGYFHPASAEGAEDVIEALLAFPSGLAAISASRLGQKKVRALVISELDRTIEIDLLRRDVTIFRHLAHTASTPLARGYRQQTIIESPALITAREPLATQFDRFVALLEGRADPSAERQTILPAHRAVASVLESAAAQSHSPWSPYSSVG
ncbi:Gfo/Idh/MocA family oxidoreductase [Saccharomonospora sp. NPDC006951]